MKEYLVTVEEIATGKVVDEYYITCESAVEAHDTALDLLHEYVEYDYFELKVTIVEE